MDVSAFIEPLEPRALLATVSIPTGIPATPGGSVTAPVSIDDGAALQALDLTITYNTNLLDTTSADVRLGSLLTSSPPAPWTPVVNVNDAAGTIQVSAFTTVPLSGGSGEILAITFQVPAGASGTSPLDILGASSLNEGGLPLVIQDGSVTIGGGANTPPVANNDNVSVDEDQTLTVSAPGVLQNDTDADGNPLTAVLVSNPGLGALTFNANGLFTYTPAANFNGTDSFTYMANDGTANSNEATVTLTVNAVNDAPVAVDDSFSVDEDQTLTVAAPGVLQNDSDVEGMPLTAALRSNVSNGTLVLNANGSFTYTPAANFNGTDSFTYAASDGGATSNTATVTITVPATNAAPVAADDSFIAGQIMPLTVAAPGVMANDTDADGDLLTAVLIASVSNGSLTFNADGSFGYTPNTSFHGTDSFTYRANDGTADSNVATVTITVQRDADIALPPGGGTYELLVVNSDLVLRRVAGEEVFRAPIATLNSVRVAGSEASESLTVTVPNGALGGADPMGASMPIVINAGGGNDTVDASSSSEHVVFSGGAGDDSLIGGTGFDQLSGDSGRDALAGGAGDDELRGQGGSFDSLTGGPGDDTLDGGAGTDVLIESGDVDFILTDTGLLGLDTDLLVSIERASLTGGAGDNRIDASRFFDDTLPTSGTARTTLLGGSGHDNIIGSRHRDLIDSGHGDDTVTAGAGVDQIFGGAGRDALDGGLGRDTINGQGGRDTLRGGGGNDLIRGGASRDLVIGGSGTDTIFGGDGADTLVGSDGDDFIRGDADRDVLRGGRGNDRLNGADGNDSLLAGPGDDTLLGGPGQDRAFGAAGNDLVDGQGGRRDTVAGGDGDDTVLGSTTEINEEFARFLGWANVLYK